MFKTTPTCSFLPLFACLLLFVAPLPLRAQDDEPEDGPAQKRAFLNVSVDYQNIIRVQLEVPAEVPDREQLKRSLSQSFSFPLEFHDTSYEDEELDDEASEEASQRPWTSLAATGPKAFSGGTLRSTFQIDPQSLLRQLQQLHVESLKVTVVLQSVSRCGDRGSEARPTPHRHERESIPS
jgi:hypothetical protein